MPYCPKYWYQWMLGQVHTAIKLACITDGKLKAQQDTPEPCALSRQQSMKWLVLHPCMFQILLGQSALEYAPSSFWHLHTSFFSAICNSAFLLHSVPANQLQLLAQMAVACILNYELMCPVSLLSVNNRFMRPNSAFSDVEDHGIWSFT